MAKVKESFINALLFNKCLDAIRPLNELMDAIDVADPVEQKLVSEIKEIIKAITSLQI